MYIVGPPGNFGGGVQSYFLFLRFLVVLNFVSFLLIAGFVLIPSIVFRSIRVCPLMLDLQGTSHTLYEALCVCALCRTSSDLKPPQTWLRAGLRLAASDLTCQELALIALLLWLVGTFLLLLWPFMSQPDSAVVIQNNTRASNTLINASLPDWRCNDLFSCAILHLYKLPQKKLLTCTMCSVITGILDKNNLS